MKRKLKPGDLVENARTRTVATLVAVLKSGCRVRNEKGRITFWAKANCLPFDQDRYERQMVLDLIALYARRPAGSIRLDEPPYAVRLGPRNPGRVISFVAALYAQYGVELPFDGFSDCASVGDIVDLVLKEHGRQAKKIA